MLYRDHLLTVIAVWLSLVLMPPLHDAAGVEESLIAASTSAKNPMPDRAPTLFESDQVLRLVVHLSTGGTVSLTNPTHPSNPSGPYTYEDEIQLVPNPDFGYVFVGWHGPVVTTTTGGVPSYHVTIRGDLYVEAQFGRNAWHNVTVNSAANGTVVMYPPDNAGRAHNGLLPDTYPRTESIREGTLLRLTAVPRGEYVFNQWQGANVPAGSEHDNPLSIIVNGPQAVTAQFVAASLLEPQVKSKPIKLYFQGQAVGGAFHLKRNGTYEILSTTPTAGQTAQEAFDNVKNYICARVDCVQSLQLLRYDPVYHNYRTERVDPPPPVLDLDYYSTNNVTRDGQIATTIEAAIAAAPTIEAKNQLEGIFLHGRWTDPSDRANRLYFRKTNSLPYLVDPASIFRTYLADAISTFFAGYPASNGVFMDDACVQPPLLNWTRRNIPDQPCFNLNRGLHAANTFTTGPNNTTIVTLRSLPGILLTAPVAKMSNGSTLTATGYTSQPDTGDADTTYTGTVTLDSTLTAPDFTISYSVEDPIVFDPMIRDSWRSNILETLSWVRAKMPTDKVIVYNPRNRDFDVRNPDVPTSDNYAFATSGAEDEYFLHSFYYPMTFPLSDWKRTIDDLAHVSASRLYLAQCGTSEDLTDNPSSSVQSGVRRLAMFLFSSFLLGKGPYGCFNFDTLVDGQAGVNYHYFDFYELDLQEPLGNYGPLGITGIYFRLFSNALVLVNPASAGSAAIPFTISNAAAQYNARVAEDGTFQAYSGGTLQGTLAPQTAVIFTRLASAANLPVITNQSDAQQVVRIGDSASLFVSASGAAPFAYQWKHNGVVITEATAATYTIQATTLADSGSYTVTVTNNAGLAISSNMTLTVMDPPIILSQPTDQCVQLGGTACFHVGPGGSAPFSFHWRKKGAMLSDTAPFSGTTTDTLWITNAPASAAGTYDCVVFNAVGWVDSYWATLTINSSALNLVSAVSRKTHDGAGDFDIAVPLWPSECRTVEPRAATKLVLTFDRDLTPLEQTGISINGSLTCASGLVCSGSTVSLSPIGTGCQDYNLTGPNLTPTTLSVNALLGDANLDGTVNLFDLIAVRDRLSQVVGQTNFTADVTGDGRINVLDMVYVRDQLHH